MPKRVVTGSKSTQRIGMKYDMRDPADSAAALEAFKEIPEDVFAHHLAYIRSWGSDVLIAANVSPNRIAAGSYLDIASDFQVDSVQAYAAQALWHVKLVQDALDRNEIRDVAQLSLDLGIMIGEVRLKGLADIGWSTRVGGRKGHEIAYSGVTDDHERIGKAFDALVARGTKVSVAYRAIAAQEQIHQDSVARIIRKRKTRHTS